MMRGAIALIAAATMLTGCGGAQPDPAVEPDTNAGVGMDTTAGTPDAPQDAWPDAGPVEYRRERAVDLTADGRDETMIVTARGPAYDSLDIALTIRGAGGDTLWHEAWPSLLYFKYDTLEGKADTTVMRMVRDHVDQLLASDRFNMQGGLPAALRRGGDPESIMREAIHYHLAELDWRRQAGLTPADRTPPEAYSTISTDSVAPERVDAVLEELKTRPSFMYYAGGEATYAIAWSSREAAFVRIHSCC